MEAQLEYIDIAYRYKFLHVWRRSVVMLMSVLINKISASELSRKFIKSALLVGWALPFRTWRTCLPAINLPAGRTKEAQVIKRCGAAFEKKLAFSINKCSINLKRFSFFTL